MVRQLYQRVSGVERVLNIERITRTGTVLPTLTFAVDQCLPVYMVTADVSQRHGWNHPQDVAQNYEAYLPPIGFAIAGGLVVVHAIQCRLIEACVIVARNPHFFVSHLAKSIGPINSGEFSLTSPGAPITMTFNVGDIYNYPGMGSASVPDEATTLHNRKTAVFAAGFRPEFPMHEGYTVPEDAPGRIRVTILFSMNPPQSRVVPIAELGSESLYEEKEIPTP